MRVRAALLTIALVTACGGDEPVPVGEVAASPSPDAMCAEHGVLEALCTQCNPALIPVFRARGDYCEEHGFPESICPACHPERGGRDLDRSGRGRDRLDAHADARCEPR